MAGQVARAVFGEWRPDAPLFDLESLEKAENVYYADRGYQPFPALNTKHTLGDCGRVYYARSFTFSDGISRSFLFTDCGIFELRTSLILSQEGVAIPLEPKWADGEKPAWDTEVNPKWDREADNSGVNWEALSSRWMCRYGDWLVYGAVGMRPRRFNPVEASAPEELGNAPVNAAHGATVGRYLFLVAGNKVYWSDAQRITTWAGADDSGNAAEVALPSGGRTLAVHGNRYAFVLCTDGVHIFSPVAGVSPFRHDEISKEVGILANHAAVMVGDYVYALSQDGVLRVGGLGQIDFIGDGRVDEWLKKNINFARAQEVIAVHDRERHVVFWQIPSNEAPEDATDLLLVYAYRDDRFSLVKETLQIALHSEQPPVYSDDSRFDLPRDQWPAGWDAAKTDDATLFDAGAFALVGIKPDQTIGRFDGETFSVICSKFVPFSYILVQSVGPYAAEKVTDQAIHNLAVATGRYWNLVKAMKSPSNKAEVMQPHAPTNVRYVKIVVGTPSDEPFFTGGMVGYDCIPNTYPVTEIDSETGREVVRHIAPPLGERCFVPDPLQKTSPTNNCDFTVKDEHRVGVYHQIELRLTGKWANLQEAAVEFRLDRPPEAARTGEMDVG